MEFENNLIAPCGMNCGICKAYLREKNSCPSCRGDDSKKAKTCANCKIKNCDFFKKGNNFCYQCPSFPCKILIHLDKRYISKYHMSMIENLKFMEKEGMENFLKKESVKWSCPSCGGTVCCHTGCCFSCKSKLL